MDYLMPRLIYKTGLLYYCINISKTKAIHVEIWNIGHKSRVKNYFLKTLGRVLGSYYVC